MLSISNFKYDWDFWVKAFCIILFKIGVRVKNHPINAVLNSKIVRHEVSDTSITVCYARSNLFPLTFPCRSLKRNLDSFSRLSFCCVQYVRSNLTHASNFFNRKTVILCCSPMAIFNSSEYSFSILDSIITSISSADFPVAHTMNINPNLSS